MSITRKGLKAMGLTEEQVESIIDAHTETVDALKDKLQQAQDDASKVADLEKQIEDLKKDGADAYKAKYENEHAEYEAYKRGVEAKEARAAKESAARDYFEKKNITGGNLDIAIRAASSEIDALELDGESIKDATKLDALVTGTLAGLVKTSETVGVNVAHPPATGGRAKMTREEIYKKDDHGRYVHSTAERQKAIAETLT